MNCFNHSDQVAVSQCRDCNKALCDYCSHFYQVPLCIQCNKGHVKREKTDIWKEMILTLIFAIVPAGILFFLLVSDLPNQPDKTMNDVYKATLEIFAIFAPIVPGWYAITRFMNKYLRSWLLIFSIPGLIVFFILKLVFSIITGFIALPIRFIMNVKKLNGLNKIPLEYN